MFADRESKPPDVCQARGPSPIGSQRTGALWLAHGFETVFVKQWSGHSKASMLSDVYGHVVTDPAGDRWRAFWLEAYDSARRPKVPERLPGVAPVRPGEAGYGRKRHR